MSAEDTFIYSQLYQLLNKLNNLRHEILSITIIRKYIYPGILLFMYHVSGVLFICHNDYLFSYNM